MDIAVQVALMEKASQVFTPGEGTFLAFPLLTPISFDPEVLGAVLAPRSAVDYGHAAEFARLVNFIPRDLVASHDGDLLWNVYADVLDRGRPGRSREIDPLVAARRERTRSLLYEVSPDGTLTESEAYRRYARYRDAYIVQMEDLNNRRITAEAGDAEMARQWKESEEPVLRAAVHKAAIDFDTVGRRSEIEAALAEERSIAAADPVARWGEWQSAFNPDVDLLSDASSRFAPTGFSPSDLDNPGSWRRFELTAAEIAKLAAEAPEALRRLVGRGPDPDTLRVSFDYRSVAVVRPWFRSEVLTSRVWDFPPDAQPLATGEAPLSGRCPAYVSALILIRDVEIHQRNRPHDSQGPASIFSIDARALSRRILPDRAPAIRLEHRVDAPVAAVLQARAFAKLSVLATARQATPAQPAAAGVPRNAALSSFRIAGKAFPHGKGGRIAPGVKSPPSSGPAPTRVTRDPGISILGFICKKLPRTPDPLPSLEWSGP